jgi:hypothetical protein
MTTRSTVLRAAPDGRARSGLVVPLAILVTTTAAAGLVVADDRSPIRFAVVGLFVLFAPGTALLDAWGLARGPLGLGLALALSTSLTTLLLLAALYSGLWSTGTTFAVLVLLTFAGELAVLERRTRPGRRRPT